MLTTSLVTFPELTKQFKGLVSSPALREWAAAGLIPSLEIPWGSGGGKIPCRRLFNVEAVKAAVERLAGGDCTAAPFDPPECAPSGTCAVMGV